MKFHYMICQSIIFMMSLSLLILTLTTDNSFSDKMTKIKTENALYLIMASFNINLHIGVIYNIYLQKKINNITNDIFNICLINILMSILLVILYAINHANNQVNGHCIIYAVWTNVFLNFTDNISRMHNLQIEIQQLTEIQQQIVNQV